MPNSFSRLKIGTAEIEDGSIIDVDVNNSAAIKESKLTFNASSGHAHNGINSKKVEYADINSKSVINADVNAAAAIVESKLAFDASAGHTHNGSNSKKVSYADIDSKNIVNADVNAAASIDRTKLNEAQDVSAKAAAAVYVYNTDNSKNTKIYQVGSECYILTDTVLKIRHTNLGYVEIQAPSGNNASLVFRDLASTNVGSIYGGSGGLYMNHATGRVGISAATTIEFTPTQYITVNKKRIKDQSIDDMILLDLFK